MQLFKLHVIIITFIFGVAFRFVLPERIALADNSSLFYRTLPSLIPAGYRAEFIEAVGSILLTVLVLAFLPWTPLIKKKISEFLNNRSNFWKNVGVNVTIGITLLAGLMFVNVTFLDRVLLLALLLVLLYFWDNRKSTKGI